MRTVGISHKTRYWQEYCFNHPPEGYTYRRALDIPWHVMGVRSEFLANTKLFLPGRGIDLFHTYNGVVANARPWVVEVESYMPRFQLLTEESKRYRWALRRLASRHCRHILFTSRWAMQMNRQQLALAGVDPAKMSVVYRAVETHPALRSGGGPFTILFAGNGFYRKGGVELLKAFRQLGRSDARLVIISRVEVDWGIFPDPGVIAWAERTIAETPGITLMRQLSHDAVIEQMQRAHVFVGTTFADPFNNTVLEAMGCGLPVICSGVGGLAEVAGHGAGLQVLAVENRGSDEIAEELSKAIGRLMDDPEVRARMGHANRHLAEEHFSLAVRNTALRRIYDSALGGPQSNDDRNMNTGHQRSGLP